MTDSAIEIVPESSSIFLAKLSDVQRTELDEVVFELNEAQTLGNLMTAKQMGRIIVERFFGGDTQTFRSDHKQHPTYRALAEHPELRPSYSSLWYAVAVYDHFQAIDEQIASALTLTHHRLLAHVRDPDERRSLAARAVTERMTAGDLDQAIQKSKPTVEPDAAKRGRPRIPEVVKSLAKARKALSTQTSARGLATIDGESFTAVHRATAIADAKRIAELATQLLARLEPEAV